MHIPFSRTIKKGLKQRKLQQQLKHEGWSFSDTRINMYIREYADWEKYYLPFDLKGKTVLDVGAGEGETALFYFNHGVIKVLCVEPDQESFERLRKNGAGRCMPLLQRKFSLDLIGYVQMMLLEQGQPGLDLVKVDIEGYEEELLQYKGVVPVVCEVHGLQLLDKFKAAGWVTVCPSRYLCTGYAFWRC
jgi:SAM-dependent methyltransferase